MHHEVFIVHIDSGVFRIPLKTETKANMVGGGMVYKRGASHDSTRLGVNTYIGNAVRCCGVDGDIVHDERVGAGSASE